MTSLASPPIAPDLLPLAAAQPTVDTAVRERAMAYPDRVALVQDGRRICYVELQCRVDRLCHALQRLGVGRQERIAVLSQWLPFGLPLRRVIRWPLWHTFLGQTIGYGPSR